MPGQQGLSTRRFGWIRDTPDQNDTYYGDLARLYRVNDLPKTVDLRALQRPIDDQGQQGSCVAQACTRAHETVISIDRGLKESFDFSRAFLYYNARVRIGMEDQDSGCQIRDAVSSLVEEGNCFEFNLPYGEQPLFEKPEHIYYSQAAEFQVTQRLRLRNTRLNELLQCLADGYPYAFGVTLYESFEEVGNTGEVPYPGWGEQRLGGHAMTAVGYDRTRFAEVVTVANSWSELWGDAGYCYMPFRYLTSRSMAADFWTIRKGENI